MTCGQISELEPVFFCCCCCCCLARRLRPHSLEQPQQAAWRQQQNQTFGAAANAASCCFENDSRLAAYGSGQALHLPACAQQEGWGVVGSYSTIAHHVFVWEGPGRRRRRAWRLHSWCTKGSRAITFVGYTTCESNRGFCNTQQKVEELRVGERDEEDQNG